jgi:tRNA G18 (ribose-2'-O)-methylase SpoU
LFFFCSFFFSSLLSSIETRKFREKKKLIYLEGRRLIEEALASAIVPTMIFYTKPEYMEDLKLPKETQVLRIRFNDLKLWSNLENPQGIVGMFFFSSTQ